MGGSRFMLGCRFGDRGWVSSYRFLFVFFCAFVFCCHMFSVPLFRWLEHDGCCVWVTSAEKLLCLLCKTFLKVSCLIIILWISLEKVHCFDFNHSLGHVYTTLFILRLLGQIYHFSLLIYPCSSLWSGDMLLCTSLNHSRTLLKATNLSVFYLSCLVSRSLKVSIALMKTIWL